MYRYALNPPASFTGSGIRQPRAVKVNGRQRPVFFAVLLQATVVRQAQVLQSQCRRLYRPEHLEAGGFIAPNRQGVRQEFPLLSLSISVVHLHPQACGEIDASQLAEMASQAKHHANVPGYSVHVIDSLAVSEPEETWLAGQR